MIKCVFHKQCQWHSVSDCEKYILWSSDSSQEQLVVGIWVGRVWKDTGSLVKLHCFVDQTNYQQKHPESNT